MHDQNHNVITTRNFILVLLKEKLCSNLLLMPICYLHTIKFRSQCGQSLSGCYYQQWIHIGFQHLQTYRMSNQSLVGLRTYNKYSPTTYINYTHTNTHLTWKSIVPVGTFRYKSSASATINYTHVHTVWCKETCMNLMKALECWTVASYIVDHMIYWQLSNHWRIWTFLGSI